MAKDNLKLQFPNYNLEYEIKFLTTPETMTQILQHIAEASPFIPEPISRDERTNVYYDTKKSFQLYRRGYECRGRMAGEGVYKYDLKTPRDLESRHNLGPDENGIFVRREYREKSGGDVPPLANFARGSIAGHLEDVKTKELVPWVKGHFERSRFTFSPTGYPDTHLEIAFETGYYESIDGSVKSEPLHIIELELKAGDYEGLVKAACQLQSKYGLEVCLKTKGEMGIEAVQDAFEVTRRAKFSEAREERYRRYPYHRPALIMPGPEPS